MDKHKSQKLLRPSKEIRKVKRELVAESQRIAIEALCKILGQCKDENTIMVSLNALEDMLKIGAQIAAEGTINAYASIVKNCGGLEDIKALQMHAREDIYIRAFLIDAGYFMDSAEDKEVVDLEEEEAPQIEDEEEAVGKRRSHKKRRCIPDD
jgi:hypothetical protein